MKQAIFEWIDNAPPTFDNFIVGGNGELCQMLHTSFACLTLWGDAGCGKTHLLRAWIAKNQGEYVSPDEILSFRQPENLAAVAFDDIHLYAQKQQAALFALFNDCKDKGIAMLFASDTPPTALTWRDDLKTRLNWGGVYEVKPLSDNDKMHALRQFANERQMYIDDAVFHYLMNFVSRDIRLLQGCLKQFDDFAVQHKRRMTVPLLKQFLQECSGI